MELNENELVQKSIAYLKKQYGEDTVRMDIRKNAVVNGNGVLEDDCTVRIDDEHSDWTKWFSFKNGSVSGMRWSPREDPSAERVSAACGAWSSPLESA